MDDEESCPAPTHIRAQARQWTRRPAPVELNAVGGAVLIALSIKLLGIRDLKVGSLLPALALAPLFAYIASLLMT